MLTLKMFPHLTSVIKLEWKYIFYSLKFDWLYLLIAILDF